MVAEESIRNIGVIGLGRMGPAIASNILKSDFNVIVYNRTADKTRSLVEAGALKATSPKEVAMKSDVLVSSLRDDRAVLDVVSSEEGILSGLQQQQRPNRIHIGTSTISPALSTHLAEMHTAHGCSYLAAPVLGNPSVANEAKLSTFVAGDPKDVERCNKLFNAYCQKIINIGNEHASANTLKLIANYVLLVLIDLMGQVYALGEKTNIDLQLISLLLDMIFGYPGLQQYSNRIRTRDFGDVGFDLLSSFKDVQLILQTSSDARVPLPFANSTKDKFLAAIANNLERKDWITIYEITRMLAGLKK